MKFTLLWDQTVRVSSLSKIIAGHPAYEVTKGELNYEVNFKNKDLLEMEPEDRARAGVF